MKKIKVNELKLDVKIWGSAWSNQAGTMATRECSFNPKMNKETNEWESTKAKLLIFNTNGQNTQMIQSLFDLSEKDHVTILGKLDGLETRQGKNGKSYTNLKIIVDKIYIDEPIEQPNNQEMEF